MKTKNQLIVISLTHWDREWRFPFQKTRMLLVQMMDGLLDLLDKQPDYRCFHLDGQTILLDDYCEVRPENKQRIVDFVKAGRLMIGPWYCLPDVNQLMGESITRNFLWGERLGREYGGNMNVGYAPASWGQISQMPQIMNGFDLESIIFYRGITADQVPGNYYIWEGKDGSALFGVRLGDWARATFFHLVDRPVVHNRGRDDQSHAWNRGGKPFRLCDSGSTSVYEFYQPPMGWYPERIEQAFKDLEEIDLGKWETPVAPAMECDDSTGPFPETPRIIEEANKLIEDDRKVTQGSLPEFIEKARASLDLDKITHISGEMRYPQRAGVWTDLYAGIQANRTPLKYAHRQAEFLLQRTAEPLSALAWTLGVPYPRWHLDQCWKWLLASEAHDSIGGCGVDAVAEDTAERFRQVQVVGGHLTSDACREIAGRIDTSRFSKDDVLFIAFNPLPHSRSAVLFAEADTEKQRRVKGFTILDLEGNNVPVQLCGKSEELVTFNHPHELPLRTRCHRWSFKFLASDVPAMGYKVYRFVPRKTEESSNSLKTGDRSMENEHLAVTINDNGTFDLYDKHQDKNYVGLGYYEDFGDGGDHWVIIRPEDNPFVNSRDVAARIRILEEGPLSTTFETTLAIRVPKGLTKNRKGRTRATNPIEITTHLQLVKGERMVRIRTTINNTCECHVLRIVFPTGLKADTVEAEMPYDVVTRNIELPDCTGWREPYDPLQVQQNMVDISDGNRGVAVLNKGLTQYEAIDTDDRALAVTLLRAVTNWNSVRLAYYDDQPGTQLQGEHTFELAVMPHAGDWLEGGCLAAAHALNVPLQVGAAGAGNGSLPPELALCELSDKRLVMTALKQEEFGSGLIARVHNPCPNTVKASLTLHTAIQKAESMNMKEVAVLGALEVRNSHEVLFEIGPHKVMTIRMNTRG